jgi:hypothetical protein
MSSKTVIKHTFSNEPPTPASLQVGELGLQIYNKQAKLFTKDGNGQIIQLGEGISNFSQLHDIDLTNLQEESFFIYRDGKFIASNSIGTLTNLSDVEISDPQSGEYLRYDEITESFINIQPSYSLSDLVDVEVADISNSTESSNQDNQVLIYSHELGKYITADRRNLINQLDDVEITASTNSAQILTRDEDGVWKNMDLHIERDISPKLGNHLNAQGFSINNSSFKVVTLTADQAIVDVNYTAGDYFIVNGVSDTVCPQCVLQVNITPLQGTSAICMLEVRQSTGAILIAGLSNIHYEDGRPIQLSGNGKIDLITILVQEGRTYITANALNLAINGLGGEPAYRYDKNRYPEVQVFDRADLYDNYFDYVRLLLNFEVESSTGRLWYQDKSDFYVEDTDSYLLNTVTTNTTQLATDKYTFGLQEFVAHFLDTSKSVQVSFEETVSLAGDFTLELYISFDRKLDYFSSSALSYWLFRNQDDSLYLKYYGSSDISQGIYFELKLGTSTFTFNNAYTYFSNREKLQVHLALVRKGDVVTLFVDGINQNPISNTTNSESIDLDSLDIILKGNINSIRLTDGVARYEDNFIPIDPRLGLLAGDGTVHDRIIFNTIYNVGDYPTNADDYIASQMFY